MATRERGCDPPAVPLARSIARGGRGISARGLRRAGQQLGATGYVLLSAALVVGLLINSRALPPLFDYNGNLDQAAQSILSGANPYHPGFLAHLVALQRAGLFSPTFAVPVYPPPVLLAFVPLGLLPSALGGGLFVVLSVVGVILALRLLGVTDWRCHAIALQSWPALFGFWLGALSPLLLLGVAAVWRWRDRVLPPAMALAAIVVAKLFPWPLGVWMILTRRWRTLGAAVAAATVGVALCWAIIGFAGLTSYARMLSELSVLEDRFGSSPVAQLLALGLPLRVAAAGGMAAGAAVLLAAWRVTHRDHDEARAFGLAVLAALVASPLVWPHYFVLVLAPVALMAPRLSPMWFVPTLCGLSPEPGPQHPWTICPYVLVLLLLLYRLLSAPAAERNSRIDTRSAARPLGALIAHRAT